MTDRFKYYFYKFCDIKFPRKTQIILLILNKSDPKLIKKEKGKSKLALLLKNNF